MANMVIVDLASLTEFEQALELFKLNIKGHCAELENGMNECGKFMQDEASQAALKGAADTIADITRCLGDVDNALDYIREMKSRLMAAQWRI